MASKNDGTPSSKLRRKLRIRIRAQVGAMQINQTKAAKRMGLSVAQTSRLLNGQDAFSLDRLVNAAESIGLRVRLA